MTIFNYEGRDQSGQLLTGQLNASSIDAAIDELSRKGVVPINITAERRKVKPFSFLQKNLFVGNIVTESHESNVLKKSTRKSKIASKTSSLPNSWNRTFLNSFKSKKIIEDDTKTLKFLDLYKIYTTDRGEFL